MTQDQNIIGDQPTLSWLQSGIAGFVGTVPMTVFMLAAQRFLPHGQRYALPPEIITKELAHRAHVRQHMNKKLVLSATLVSHFGYGAAMGTLYAPVARRLPLPAIVKGMLFGLMVWAASYLGLLPLLGLWESAYVEPSRRNLMMIAAHIVWGASTGATASFLMDEQETITTQTQNPPAYTQVVSFPQRATPGVTA
jgi:putative membrane protein